MIWLLVGIFICLLAIVLISSSKTTILLTDESIDLSKVLPIQCIENDLIINGNGDITAGFRVFFPEVFTLSEERADKMHDDWISLLKMLPVGTVVHQQTFVYESTYYNNNIGDIQNFIARANARHQNGKNIMNSYSNIYITFVNSGFRKSATNNSLLRKLNHVFTQPYKNLNKRKNEIESTLMNVLNSLTTMDIGVTRMDDIELNNCVFDFTNQSYNNPTNDATKEVVDPMCISDQGDLVIGDKFIKILSLAEEGSSLEPLKTPKTIPSSSFENDIDVPHLIKSKASLVYPIVYGLPIDHVVNTVIEITDTDNTLSHLKLVNRGLNILASFYKPAESKQTDINAFCKSVTEHNYTTAFTSINVILSDTDRYRLERKISIANTAFSNMNQSVCYKENYDTANLFFSSIPGNARANYRGFINTTAQAVSYICKESLYMSSDKGYIFCDRFGKPSVVDIFDNPLVDNKNWIEIGPSGSGKSVNLNEIILQSHIMLHDQIIIDKGGSYRTLITINEGKYYDAREKKSFSFNPFICAQDDQGQYLYNGDPTDPDTKDDVIIFIRTLISLIWKGSEPLLQIEKVLLDNSIRDFYVHVNRNKIKPSLKLYADFLKNDYRLEEDRASRIDFKELFILLEPYTSGEYYHLFNAEENIDIKEDRLIGFDLEGLDDEIFSLVVCLILNLVTDKINYRRGIRKNLYIDEALDFLKDKKMGDFIAMLFRQFRKKEGSIGIAAQKVDFLEEAPDEILKSIVANCDIKIILNHKGYEAEYPKLKQFLSLTDDDIDMVDSLQKDPDTQGHKWREFCMKFKTKMYVFRQEVSPTAIVAYDSREKFTQKLKEYYKETKNMETAIDLMIKYKSGINKKA